MAQFQYTAQTAEGKKIKGTMNAADEAQVQQLLREKDAFLLTVKEVRATRSMRQFKPKVLADFSRQLSTLTAAGVTLVRALTIIASGEAVRPKERTVYEDLVRQIRQGVALSDAMEQQNGVFPPLMIYMFRSAESSGNLDKVSMQMATLYEKDHKLNSKISSSMTYPKILAVMIVGVILILTQFVLPQFEEMFDQMEELPALTQWLLNMTDFVAGYWYVIVVVVAMLFVGVRTLMTIPKVRRSWHWFLIHMPVIGKLQKTICTYRFSRTLSSLYAAGIPIVTSLQIAKKTIGNDYIELQFDTVIPFVRAGNYLSDGLDQIDGFVRKLTDAIRVGEETGSLDSMLASTAETLEYDADMAINKMVSYVEPLMLIIMGIIVALVMGAVFGAIYGSYDSIAGM